MGGLTSGGGVSKAKTTAEASLRRAAGAARIAKAAWTNPMAWPPGHPALETDGCRYYFENDFFTYADAPVFHDMQAGRAHLVGCVQDAARWWGTSGRGQDVRPYAVVVGNSAREIKRRFSEEVVESLLRIAWWDWDDATILERVDELCCPDVAAFCARYDPAWNAKSNG